LEQRAVIPSTHPPLDAVRVDKWLWAARLFKTRSLASHACAAGHVTCNGGSIKASRVVKVGDKLDVVTPGGRRIVCVLRIHDKRGPAPLARTLYDDQTPPEMREPARDPLGFRDRGAGRPSKRDRRALRQLRGR
jgi:ribosome-associated heat shock protein Hsp15